MIIKGKSQVEPQSDLELSFAKILIQKHALALVNHASGVARILK
jgi:hypothetical protein